MRKPPLTSFICTAIVGLVVPACSTPIEPPPPGTTTAATVLILPSKAPAQPQQAVPVAPAGEAPARVTPATPTPGSAVAPSIVAEPVSTDDPAVVGPVDPPKYGEKRASVQDTPFITYEQYQKLTNGQSYEQVSELFGRPGKEEFFYRVGDSSTARYSWTNPDGSYVIVWFSNNKVSSKYQLQLR